MVRLLLLWVGFVGACGPPRVSSLSESKPTPETQPQVPDFAVNSPDAPLSALAPEQRRLYSAWLERIALTLEPRELPPREGGVFFEDRSLPWLPAQLMVASGSYEGGHDFYDVAWMFLASGDKERMLIQDRGHLVACEAAWWTARSELLDRAGPNPTASDLKALRSQLQKTHCIDFEALLTQAWLKALTPENTEPLTRELLELIAAIEGNGRGARLVSDTAEVEADVRGHHLVWHGPGRPTPMTQREEQEKMTFSGSVMIDYALSHPGAAIIHFDIAVSRAGEIEMLSWERLGAWNVEIE